MRQTKNKKSKTWHIKETTVNDNHKCALFIKRGKRIQTVLLGPNGTIYDGHNGITEHTDMSIIIILYNCHCKAWYVTWYDILPFFHSLTPSRILSHHFPSHTMGHNKTILMYGIHVNFRFAVEKQSDRPSWNIICRMLHHHQDTHKHTFCHVL